MDSLKFCDVRVEKSKAKLKYRSVQLITTLFRLIELFVFLIIVVPFCARFHFSVRGILVTLLSPRFVFVIGNVIVAVLLLKSGRFSAEIGGKGTDFYDEYVEKFRRNHQIRGSGKERQMDLSRSKSEKMAGVAQVEERHRELRRSMTERCQRAENSGKKNAAANGGLTSYWVEDEMSSEDFRRTVEAFIARRQRLLREDEALSDVVSYES